MRYSMSASRQGAAELQLEWVTRVIVNDKAQRAQLREDEAAELSGTLPREASVFTIGTMAGGPDLGNAERFLWRNLHLGASQLLSKALTTAA